MSDDSVETPYEEKEIRCPKLGGPANFGYCRLENLGKPCSRTIGCWSPHFDVEEYLRQTLSEEEFQQFLHQPPPSKLNTLLEMIERARKIAEAEPQKDQAPTQEENKPE